MSASFSVEKTALIKIVILTLKLTIFKAQFHITKNVCETDTILVNDYEIQSTCIFILKKLWYIQ